MEELIKKDETIRPMSEKEQAVWMALDKLYFEDNNSIKNITLEKIQDTRKHLEGRAGDRKGLSDFKARWMRRNGIDPLLDPKGPPKFAEGADDPLLRIAADMRSQLRQSIEAEKEAEINRLNAHIEMLSKELDELREAHRDLRDQFISSTNELQLSREEAKANHDKAVSNTAKFEVLEREYQEYKVKTEQEYEASLIHEKKRYEDFKESSDKTIHDLNFTLSASITKHADDLDKAKQQYVDELHDLMMKNENLKTENAKVKSEAIARKLLVDEMKSQIIESIEATNNNINGINEEMTRNTEKLSSEINSATNAVNTIEHDLLKIGKKQEQSLEQVHVALAALKEQVSEKIK